MPASPSTAPIGSTWRARAFAFIRDEMTGADGRLLHSWREGRRGTRPASTITRICAAPRWRCTRRPSMPAYLEQVRRWVEMLDRHYWDASGGGYFFAADDTQDLIARVKTASDAAVPAGNGTMVGVLKPVRAADRRAVLPRARRGDRRGVLRRTRAQFLPARDTGQQCRVRAEAGADRAGRRSQRSRLRGVAARRLGACRCRTGSCWRSPRTRHCRRLIRPLAKAWSAAARRLMSAKARSAHCR